jgi:hypothetical protein
MLDKGEIMKLKAKQNATLNFTRAIHLSHLGNFSFSILFIDIFFNRQKTMILFIKITT